MANFTREGYGQVEPNQLSGIKTGQIYASLPLDTAVNVLQQGEFMFYDVAGGKVTATPAYDNTIAEPYLVYQEVKLYEDYLRYKDFAMIKAGENYITQRPYTGELGGGWNTTSSTAVISDYRTDYFAPRLVKTNVGDIFTTNMVETGVEYAVGNVLYPVLNTTSNTLVLAKSGTAVSSLKFVVAKVYTMPDGQPGLKLQRIV